MTEADWLECADPTMMLEFLRGKASDRKLRLFAVACCRNTWNVYSHDKDLHHAAVCLKFIDLGERIADGFSDDSERTAAEEAALPLFDIFEESDVDDLGVPFHHAIRLIDRAYSTDNAIQCATSVAAFARFSDDEFGFEGIDSELLGEQSAIVVDMFGNPFRPVAIDPRWLTSTVLDLSHAIYDERAFDRMPILADALMDAGCDSEEIINHCRGVRPHVRGCWVVDLLLGKS